MIKVLWKSHHRTGQDLMGREKEMDALKTKDQRPKCFGTLLFLMHELISHASWLSHAKVYRDVIISESDTTALPLAKM